ncbi:NgoMIV family type II restriction endonuclease [Streptomyces sp. NPDC020719]|uniref:NgoMIV family type II restriction endonuclease n=1 Tax=Streptomyces sp. NPDC020719 TaxID=3154896 RepID=UPI0033C5746B
MPAPFVIDLCGYRDGRPSTSDKNDSLSIELGQAFFDMLGVPQDKPAAQSVDKKWSAAMVEDLGRQLSDVAPHLVVRAERRLEEFEQYAHLKALKSLAEDTAPEVSDALSRLEMELVPRQGAAPGIDLAELAADLRAAMAAADDRRRALIDLLADESPLRLDVAVDRPDTAARNTNSGVLPHLVAGFSLKWSLRTDRLQDPRTQGAKMASMRRGRMPHFATVTMEPRPYMLGRLGRGTGDLDCVYHLALPTLIDAVEAVYVGPARSKQRDMFMRMVEQRRLRDYDDLVAYVGTL